jgi:hypothetical protein
MAKKRYSGYTIKARKYCKTKREALALVEDMKAQFGGMYRIVPQALDVCPGDLKTGDTMDHAHARYDGENFCDYCKGEL